jgi:hypothetical protein
MGNYLALTLYHGEVRQSMATKYPKWLPNGCLAAQWIADFW